MRKYLFHIRNLLQDDQQDTLRAIGSPSITYDPPDPHNTSSTAPFKRHFDEFNPPNSSTNPLDSSMALTILVILTALFFMAFFSLYIRRFSTHNSSTLHVTSPPPPPRPHRVNNNSKGLDPSAVRSLPMIPYGGDAKHPNDCSICLSEFEEREMVKIIPYCMHGFHPQCIDTWLSTHVSCPLCRSTQLFPAADEVHLGVVGEDGNDGVSERSTVDDRRL